jgi:hypothetical protein
MDKWRDFQMERILILIIAWFMLLQALGTKIKSSSTLRDFRVKGNPQRDLASFYHHEKKLFSHFLCHFMAELIVFDD